MSATVEAVRDIRGLAAELGVQVSASHTSITATKRFTPGDKGAYVQAEDDCLRVLRLARTTRPGSTWGTDSGSVGGAVGLAGGYCTLHKSGVDKRVLARLRNTK